MVLEYFGMGVSLRQRKVLWLYLQLNGLKSCPHLLLMGCSGKHTLYHLLTTVLTLHFVRIDYNKYEELVEAINSRYKLGTDVAPVNDG